jgi:hypothetical protein
MKPLILAALCLLSLVGCDSLRGPAGPQGDKGTVEFVPLSDGGFTLGGSANVSVVQGPAGPIGVTGPAGPQGVAGPMGATGAQGPVGPAGPQGVAGPSGPTGAAGSGAVKIVDAAGHPVGPYFLTPGSFNAVGYLDAAGALWSLNLDTGLVTSVAAFGLEYAMYPQANCSGAGWFQFGYNGNGFQTPSLPNAVILRSGSSGTPEYRVRHGAPLSSPPAACLSYRGLTGACVNGSPAGTGYGPYFMISDMPVVTVPSLGATAPLHLSL